MDLLFTHISLRASQNSTIIITNLSGAPLITAVMIDRLTHKPYVFNMNGISYRVKETKA